ncbi:MAG: hypothetical protein H7311_00310 [Ramlibacter sp.]|nr:hypothetical protein [Cryobacterium sp.]
MCQEEADGSAELLLSTPVVVGLGADWSEGWWMVGIALIIGVAAVLGVRRRDLAL